ncbi:MAG: dihydromonapterin reductase [Coxiella sp. (in: Bacteria)]|nr:MAG: dihydromonapterin reductase [Coxiella sp. (in: g-proteobacteria)]
MRRGPKIPLPKAVVINTIHQPTLGNASAKLHIVAFEDLKCSNCMRYNLTIFPKIYDQYIKTGKAKYTVITLAFIKGSIPAGNAAKCVYAQNHQAFFDYVKYIYSHQPPETENWATIPNLMLYATHVKGVNQDTLSKCLVASPYSQTMLDNLDIAKKIMGADGVSTPRIYVNGVEVTPLSWKNFQNVVNEAE